MFRILYRIVVVACCLLFVCFDVDKASAQTGYGQIQELTTFGEQVQHSRLVHTYFANDDKGNSWVVTPDNTWSFNHESHRWTKWPTVIFEDVEVRLGHDKARDRFLFWNGGVGKVFEWQPGDTSVKRLDRSFHHRTQFGHSWFIHPETSDIYAFGGYGFWQSRGYTARYDQTLKEWQVVTLDATKPYPSARAGAMHTYDEKNGEFHIFGGHNYRHDGREDLSVDFVDFKDYWVLNIERREWTQYPLYGLSGVFDINAEIQKVQESFYYGLDDSTNEFSWYPLRIPESPYDIRLMVFDRTRKFGTLTPITLGTLGHKSGVYWYAFDAPNNQILMFWVPEVSAGNDRILRVSSLHLPHPDSTRAMMDMIRMYGSVNPPDKASNYWLLFVLLPIMGGGVWFWKRKRLLVADAAQKLAERETEFVETDAYHPTVTFCFVGHPRLLIDHEEVKNQIGDAELHLMFWLYWKHRLGEPFQITDRIEEVFWTDSPNLDYIRKQRNTTLRRLNEHLSDALGHYEPSHAWVTDRASIIDKRKREYALDLNGLRVRCDLDEDSAENISPSDVLATCKGTWADQIRDEFAAGRPSNNFANMKAGA